MDAIGEPVGTICGALLPYERQIHLAFVFGSVAAKTHTEASDIDLMVVGEVSSRTILEALSRVQDHLAHIVNPTVFSLQEFTDRIHGDDPYIGRVLDGPRLFIIGSNHDIDRLVE